MTVLHVITRLDRGGAAKSVLDLTRGLSLDGVHVVLIAGRTDDPETDITVFAAQNAINFFTIPQLVREVSPINDFIAFIKIRKIIKQIKPDIVHTHTSKAGILGRFAAWSTGTRYIVHSPRGHIFYGYYGSLSTAAFALLERIAAKVTDKISVLTERGLRDHVAMRIGPERLFTVIHSGVDVWSFMAGDGAGVRAEIGWKNGNIVGWVGRLVPIKDCMTFVRACALVRSRIGDVRFIVAGDGEERARLEEEARKLDLEHDLVFLGDRSDIPSVMAAFDVCVLSSLNEGFGRVLVEAMAAGAVMIATRVGGTVDVIEDGVSGILVPPSDPSGIADAVCEVLGNAELKNRLIQGGRERARVFDMDATVAQFEDLYETLHDV